MAMSEPPAKARRSVQSTIKSFFPAPGAATSSSSAANLTAPATTPDQVHLPNVDVDQEINPRQLPLAATANGIGRAEDCAIFVTPWIPTADSDVPTSTHTRSGVQRIRRRSRVESKKGAFCVPCVLFAATAGVGGRGEKLHVMTAKGNATYLSASIRNAIISTAGDLVAESVITRIKST